MIEYITSGSIYMNYRDMIIICSYAPTELGNEETKDVFYKELEQPYDTLPDHCVKSLLTSRYEYSSEKIKYVQSDD